MPDRNETPLNEEKGYTPASFEKRTAAWMGIAYMLMLLFVVTYSIFTGGKSLPGTFPLFLIPVCVAVAVIAVYRQKKGVSPLVLTILVLLACAAGVLLGLGLGGPALIYALQNSYTL